MIRNTFWLLFFAAAFVPPAHAREEQPCDNAILEAVARWAGIKSSLVYKPDGLISAAACKAMPNTPNTVIAAIAFDIGQEAKNVDEDSKEQVIALVEAGKVLAANRSTIIEDAATVVGSYRIDTARYLLSGDARAFGVVFDSSARGASCPDANAGSELTLWIREGKNLRAVMGTNLWGIVGVDGPLCSIVDRPDPEVAEVNLTIGVEKTVTYGFADLSLTARDSENPKRVLARTVLKYDGRSYGIDMFRNFWYPPAAKKRWDNP